MYKFKMNVYKRNLSEVDSNIMAFSGSNGSFDSQIPNTSYYGPKDSMADSTYSNQRPADYDMGKSGQLDNSANRGTLVEMQMRNNSDNEVIDLAKFYQE
jgi:hypothetical protein